MRQKEEKYSYYYFTLLYFRFPIEIKHPHPKMDGCFNNEEMQMFLEEAKNMLKIGEYHENIVNLQGLVYGKEDIEKGLPKVRFLFAFNRGKIVGICI